MHRVPDTLKNSLHQWLAETAEKEHITAAQEGSADITSEQITQDSYYLLVKFEPSNDKKDEFEIHAWLTYEQDGKTMPVYGDAKEEVSLVEIPSILDELISQYEEYAHAFTIELFLPFILLNCDTSESDVHSWKLDAGFGNSIAMSQKYPLVLRSYDRVYEINKLKPGVRRGIRKAWGRNWTFYKNCGT